jgi:hypothetical protein
MIHPIDTYSYLAMIGSKECAQDVRSRGQVPFFERRDVKWTISGERLKYVSSQEFCRLFSVTSNRRTLPEGAEGTRNKNKLGKEGNYEKDFIIRYLDTYHFHLYH